MRGLKCLPAEAVRSRVVASSGHVSRQFPAVRESLENTGDAPPAGQLPLGTVVAGRYVIRRMLGHGGAASVYAAEHLVVKRSVALKLPHLDPDLREVLFARLRRETRALAAVRHPVVVDVIDGGDSDGMPFVAMQLLEGRTLSGLLASRGSLEPDAVVKIGVQLASGLAAIHAAGIIHRDVKPANVIVTRDTTNQVRLFDFGVAKLAGTPEVVDSKLTQSGAILGTVEYMAPEALLSLPTNDHRADMYSLGVTLYECATGAVPFDGGLGQVLLRITTSEPTPLAQVKPGIPKALADIVHRCLAREPEKRFASMAELALALAACGSKKLDAIDVLGDARGRAAPPPPPPPRNRAGGAPAQPATPQPAAPAPAAQPPPEARRKLARAPYVTLCTLHRDHASSVDARIEDISEGGVLLVASEACNNGDVVRIRFASPMTGKMVDIAALVRWSRSSRGTRATGLEFQALPDATRTEIKQYVELMGPSKPA
jgi:tRNA A-37 threonylcarbamoyl transferase component Bud32